jgi:hypothetical protein
MTLPTETSVLGGPYNGYSGIQSISNYNNDGDVLTRKELRRSWNTAYAKGTFNNYKRRIGPFRAITNSGDFLSRTDYICGGPNPANNTHARSARPLGLGGIISACDGTNVPATSCNVKFVADSSDYTKFKRQTAYNNNYNDLKHGGYNNSAYVPLMAVRGGAKLPPH